MVNYTDWGAHLPSNDTVAGFSSLFTWVNDSSGGIFGPLILLATFIIMFISIRMGGGSAKKAFAPAAFITTIIGILFRGIGMVDDKYVIILIILTIVSIAWLFSRDEQ